MNFIHFLKKTNPFYKLSIVNKYLWQHSTGEMNYFGLMEPQVPRFKLRLSSLWGKCPTHWAICQPSRCLSCDSGLVLEQVRSSNSPWVRQWLCGWGGSSCHPCPVSLHTATCSLMVMSGSSLRTSPWTSSCQTCDPKWSSFFYELPNIGYSLLHI